jgi:hypothetical protein
MEKSLSENKKYIISKIVADQIGVNSVTILKLFRSKDWKILYVEPYNLDNIFLFYDGEFKKEHYVTSWSGAAYLNEQKSILDWTQTNASGIPLALAKCFSWYATLGLSR